MSSEDAWLAADRASAPWMVGGGLLSLAAAAMGACVNVGSPEGQRAAKRFRV